MKFEYRYDVFKSGARPSEYVAPTLDRAAALKELTESRYHYMYDYEYLLALLGQQGWQAVNVSLLKFDNSNSIPPEFQMHCTFMRPVGAFAKWPDAL